MKESIMNQEKLAKLQAQVRIGGKGSARRKKKVVHRTATADDKKLQFSLKKLGVNNISGIEEVNMFTNLGTVIHFNNPKVQASLAANTFTITGHAENKQLTEMLPGILNQLGADSLTSLRRLAETLPKPAGDNKAPMVAAEEEDDEVPVVVANKANLITLTCGTKTDGGVTWKFDGEMLEDVGLEENFQQDGQNLTVKGVDSPMLGEYSCWRGEDMLSSTYLLLEADGGGESDSLISCRAKSYDCNFACTWTNTGYTAVRLGLGNECSEGGKLCPWVYGSEQPQGGGLQFELSHTLSPYAEESTMLEVTAEAISDLSILRTTKRFYLRDIVQPDSPQIIKCQEVEQELNVTIDPPSSWSTPHSFFSLEHQIEYVFKDNGKVHSCLFVLTSSLTQVKLQVLRHVYIPPFHQDYLTQADFSVVKQRQTGYTWAKHAATPKPRLCDVLNMAARTAALLLHLWSVFSHFGRTSGLGINELLYFRVISPEEIGYIFSAAPAKDFGGDFTSSYDEIFLVPADPADGCSDLEDRENIQGQVILVERGGCSFVQKARHVEEAGGKAVLIADNAADNDSQYLDMITDGSTTKPNIPALFLLGRDGSQL
ncbi:hypothetical protein L3Q82_006875 [Scortum barcoo]|uniref:Uncharacterized protein n=1 Tax=Scortum barcoo TaxID=214431 RepID=A0ACB8WVE8_9TELE|nr:hypothetical protein L3Q82_006875 [Scortum barcoo]